MQKFFFLLIPKFNKMKNPTEKDKLELIRVENLQSPFWMCVKPQSIMDGIPIAIRVCYN